MVGPAVVSNGKPVGADGCAAMAVISTFRSVAEKHAWNKRSATL
jgi:hypothetical protein